MSEPAAKRSEKPSEAEPSTRNGAGVQPSTVTGTKAQQAEAVQSRKGQRGFKLWIAVLAVLFVIGGSAIVYRLVEGLSVTNLNQFVPWGAWIVFYIFFVGLSAGAFLLSTLIFVFGMEQYEKVGRYALFTAFVCMIVALTFVFLDIGRMERFWHSLAYWNILSMLSWEVRFYLVYVVLLMTELYFSMRVDLITRSREGTGWVAKLSKWLTLGSTDTSEESQKKDHRWMKILGILGIPIAIIGVHGGTGTLFAFVKAQPYWNSALFPIVFVVSALVSGTALLTAMYVIQNKVRGREVDVPMVKGLANLMVFFLAIDLLLEFYEFLVGFYNLEPAEMAIFKVMFTGPFSWSFWGVQILLGSVVPIVIVASKKLRDNVWWLMAAAILIVVGIIGVRFNIVVPTQIVHPLEGMPHGYYSPNLVEWLASIGVVAMGLIIYSFGAKWLPLEVEDKAGEEEVMTRG